MRAVVVFPTPRTPVRIQACGMRPVSNALEMVRTIASCPIRSAKVAGRYLRASTRYEPPAGVGPRSNPGLVASFIAVVHEGPLLCPLPLRERAAPNVQQIEWVRGCDLASIPDP